MRLQEAINIANQQLQDWNNLEPYMVKRRRMALQELMTITRYGQETAVLYKKAKNRIEFLILKLKQALRDKTAAEAKVTILEKNNDKLRRALLIFLAEKTSQFDPKHRPATYWRDWALQQAIINP